MYRDSDASQKSEHIFRGIDPNTILISSHALERYGERSHTTLTEAATQLRSHLATAQVIVAHPTIHLDNRPRTKAEGVTLFLQDPLDENLVYVVKKRVKTKKERRGNGFIVTTSLHS